MRRPEAISAGVAAADDDDVAVPGADELAVRDAIPFAPTVLQRQILHREVNALELTAGNGKIPRLTGASGEQHGVVIRDEASRRNVDADVHARPEHHALCFHDRQPPVEEALLHLELGNPVSQQSPDAI